MSKVLMTFAVLSACAFSCARLDPSDPKAIEKDLKNRTAQQVHDAADKFSYTPPEDRQLTEAQIASYVKVMRVADQIRTIAERSAGEAIDRGQGVVAFGSARNFATAELRACLDLGVNPKEHEWVAQHIASAMEAIASIERWENEVAAKKAEYDAEIDPVMQTPKRHAYERAVDEKERWENSQDPATVANAKLVRTHRHEIGPTR